MIGKILEQSKGKKKEALLGENCFATIKEYLQQFAFTEVCFLNEMEKLNSFLKMTFIRARTSLSWKCF